MSKYKLQQKTNKENISVYSIDLTVAYNVYGKLIELSQGTGEASTFNFKILDEELDEREMSVLVDFSSPDELIDIIKDFKSKLKTISK